MVSRVLYRPFEEDDFDVLAEILQLQWHTKTENGVFNYLEACDDLAYCLSTSTFSQVALVDGAPRGIALARSGDPEPAWSQRWLSASKDFLGQMEHIDQQGTERYRAFIDEAERLNTQMIQEGAVDTSSEIVLLAVAESARGLGIGSILFDAAVDYVAACGHATTYLVTDSTCDWQFYERRGLKRVAHHRATREERRLVPRDMYLYGIDLTA